MLDTFLADGRSQAAALETAFTLLHVLSPLWPFNLGFLAFIGYVGTF